MSTLTSFKGGLEVVTPDPGGAGGLAINDNFKRLGRLAVELAIAPPGASDDSTKDFAAGSVWFDTTAGQAWICTDASVGAAVWVTLAGGTAANVADTVVRRDGNGDFAARRITAADALRVLSASFAAPSSGTGLEFRYVSSIDVGSILSYSRDVSSYKPLTLEGSIVNVNTSGGGTRMTVDSSGNVGIGTMTPGQKLDLGGSGNIGLNGGSGSGGGSVYLDGGEVKKLRAENHSGAPSSPVAGQIYFDTGNSHFYGYDGTSWMRLDN